MVDQRIQVADGEPTSLLTYVGFVTKAPLALRKYVLKPRKNKSRPMIMLERNHEICNH